MRRLGPVSRILALVALGAFSVHFVRFLIELASGVHDEPQLRGQSALGHVPPTLAAIGFLLIATRLWLSWTGAAVVAAPARRTLWTHSLAFGMAIASVYVAQEMLETALFAGHAQGIAGVLAGGGWVAIAAALLLGPLCCLLSFGIGRIETRVARLAQDRLGSTLSAPALTVAAPQARPPRLAPLAFGLARRPPPLLAR